MDTSTRDPPGAAPVVRVSEVNHYFGEGDSRNQVLFDNSIEIPAGQVVMMSGPSGSGKTTLLTLIGALRSVQEGRVELLGGDVTGLTEKELVFVRRDVGFIFQLHNLFHALSAYENVQMAMQLGRIPGAEMRARGTAILARLGLGDRVDYKPKALSGGQRQRVAVARALVNRPKIVLADEPTAALDLEASNVVVDLLKELAREDGSSILMVTHDNRILDAADRIVNMVDGRIVSDVVVNRALQVCAFLRDVDAFRHLSPTQLTEVAEKMKGRAYEAGQDIIRQGDKGDEFFLIADGTVDVTVRRGKSVRRVATLGKGEFFGEAALISGGDRNATVTTMRETSVYVLGKEDFTAALEHSATFKDQLLNIYFQRQ